VSKIRTFVLQGHELSNTTPSEYVINGVGPERYFRETVTATGQIHCRFVYISQLFEISQICFVGLWALLA
jgi:hypothetical protein